jgi:ABC-type amino acid transport substrate-binding protein
MRSHQQIQRRAVLCGVGAALTVSALHPVCAAGAEPLKTVEPGALTIACSGEMPRTNVRDGRLVGVAGDMVSLIADRLALKPVASLMDWSATIESVRGGRADVVLGNMGWTPQRSQVLLLTEAVHYAGMYALMRQDQPAGKTVSLDDFKGHVLGTVQGFTIVADLKNVAGAAGVKLYDNTDACVRDVRAGRCDFAFLDTPTVAYMVQQNSDWGLKLVLMPELPGFKTFGHKQLSIFGLNPANTDLFDAVNAGVKWLWRSGKNAEVLANYGFTDRDYLTALTPDPRVGIDRDADGHVTGKFAHFEKDFSTLFL